MFRVHMPDLQYKQIFPLIRCSHAPCGENALLHNQNSPNQKNRLSPVRLHSCRAHIKRNFPAVDREFSFFSFFSSIIIFCKCFILLLPPFIDVAHAADGVFEVDNLKVFQIVLHICFLKKLSCLLYHFQKALKLFQK